jgi:hypothetical protein
MESRGRFVGPKRDDRSEAGLVSEILTAWNLGWARLGQPASRNQRRGPFPLHNSLCETSAGLSPGVAD